MKKSKSCKVVKDIEKMLDNQIKIKGVRCPKCKSVIYSRARHDMHSCPCGKVSIDGGFDYLKVSADPKICNKVENATIIVNATKDELYYDWACMIDKFGVIKGENL